MSETTYNLEKDLSEADAMARALVPYVYEKDLYGRVGGGGIFSGGTMPSLTIGALLLRLRRLRAQRDSLTPKQQAQLEQIEARHEQVRHQWAAAYEGKLVKEALSRLDAMKAYFDECSQSPRLCASAYLPEALRRTIVEEIRLAMRDYNIASAQVDSKARAT
ncbi:MAG: hypothetical protein HXY40_07845, partial [Chloroflexi bacterium]|nr:hypothetical protein [Chloroflexota bacterium]